MKFSIALGSLCLYYHLKTVEIYFYVKAKIFPTKNMTSRVFHTSIKDQFFLPKLGNSSIIGIVMFPMMYKIGNYLFMGKVQADQVVIEIALAN